MMICVSLLLMPVFVINIGPSLMDCFLFMQRNLYNFCFETLNLIQIVI